MTLNMNDDAVVSMAQLKELIKLGNSAAFIRNDQQEAYTWINNTLGKFRYFGEIKKNRSIIKDYLMTMTGYSDPQIDRLIARKKRTGRIVKGERTQPTFPKIYTPEDIALLVMVDNAEERRTGQAVRKTFKDMYTLYDDPRFRRLAKISVSHIYNLRGTRIYQSKSLTYTKTNPVTIPIGMRMKPRPEGKPGFIRVDSVHQGDLDKVKGVYHINLVDEVTQAEIVVTVEGISEYFLIPVLEEAFTQFPFVMINFHSDNGSEYINKTVARLLNKLMIEQTKSRSRKTNDNALVEGKNAAVVRKHFGYAHIPKKYAPLINEFNRDYLNPYLFFHRQCAFADDEVDDRGKIKKIYRTYLTPCEKLLLISNVEQYLREGVTLEILRQKMFTESHLTSAQTMQVAKQQLFEKINHDMVQ
jgi:predicted DNA-binding transcriptional regulator AlpA